MPSLESIETQQHEVYREEDESDYQVNNIVDDNNDDDDDEPSCKIQVKRTTVESESKPQTGTDHNTRSFSVIRLLRNFSFLS